MINKNQELNPRINQNFCYSLKNQLNEQFSNKISSEDKKYIENLTKETLNWMDAHQDATKEEYESKMKEVEGKIQPIFAKLYQAGGASAGGMPGGSAPQQNNSKQSDAKGPKIEEVD